MPTAHDRPVSAEHPRLDRRGERLGVVGAHADERLVPAPHLDHHRERRAASAITSRRRRVVGRAVRRQEHGVGAPAGAPRRAACPSAPRTPAPRTTPWPPPAAAGSGRRRHRPRRAPGQLGAAQHLDRGEELVEVDVQDPRRRLRATRRGRRRRPVLRSDVSRYRAPPRPRPGLRMVLAFVYARASRDPKEQRTSVEVCAGRAHELWHRPTPATFGVSGRFAVVDRAWRAGWTSTDDYAGRLEVGEDSRS